MLLLLLGANMVGWLAGWLVGWSAGWLAGWLLVGPAGALPWTASDWPLAPPLATHWLAGPGVARLLGAGRSGWAGLLLVTCRSARSWGRPRHGGARARGCLFFSRRLFVSCPSWRAGPLECQTELASAIAQVASSQSASKWRTGARVGH